MWVCVFFTLCVLRTFLPMTIMTLKNIFQQNKDLNCWDCNPAEICCDKRDGCYITMSCSHHQKHWKVEQEDIVGFWKPGSQLENLNQDGGVCGVTVHAHVFKTNSQQVKSTLLDIQVMTRLLSAWSSFACTMLLMRRNRQDASTSHLCLLSKIALSLFL